MSRDMDGRPYKCAKCGESGIMFTGCGMSECEAMPVSRVPPYTPSDDPQPARFRGIE